MIDIDIDRWNTTNYMWVDEKNGDETWTGLTHLWWDIMRISWITHDTLWSFVVVCQLETMAYRKFNDLPVSNIVIFQCEITRV